MSTSMYIIACILCSILVIALADYVYRYVGKSWGSASSLARKAVEESHVDATRIIVAGKSVSESVPTVTPAPNESVDVTTDNDPYGLGEYAKQLLK
jgi:hypothetical protein